MLLRLLGASVLSALGACDAGENPVALEDATSPASGITFVDAPPPPLHQGLEQILETARAHLRKEEVEPALELLESTPAAKDDPELRRECVRALLLNTDDADPGKALRILESTSWPMEWRHEILILASRAAWRQRQARLCRDYVTELLAADPPRELRAEGHFLLGSLAEQEGEFEPAAAHFADALKIAPEYAHARFRRGAMEFELGRTEQAAADIEAALKIMPDLLAAHFQLAQVYRKLGRNTDAGREHEIHRHLTQFLRLRSEKEEAYLKRFEALEHLESIYPQYRAGRVELLRYRLIRGMNEDAAKASRGLIEEMPSDTELYPLYVEALRRGRGDQQARAAIDDLLTAVPGIPEQQRRNLGVLVRNGFPPR